jgi:hypothetical protein
MGYNTTFKGLLTFKKQPTQVQLDTLDSILGEDCRDHPEWNRTDLTYIDLIIDPDLRGLEWSESEKTYDLCEKINLVVDLMRRKFPDFGLEGELLAQGEDINHRYCIVYDDELDIFEHRSVDDVIDSLSELREKLQMYEALYDEFQFNLGDRVEKINGDYKFPGVVVSAFKNTKGSIRYVIESTSKDTQGMLHIFNEVQLRLL